MAAVAACPGEAPTRLPGFLSLASQVVV